MTLKQYRNIRILAAIFISSTISTAVVQNNFWLAIAAVVAGMITLIFAKRKTPRLKPDERVISVSQKAASYTYSIFTVFIALLSIALYFVSDNSNVRLLATTLSYLTISIMILYSILFWYFNHQTGGGPDEE